ncbi:branched-chain amino acid aminotransferase [Pseudarthrobacter raffinosi]|uniref:branched-chain amino acid aminotransferase n=1 Tax=Pseudarthrobacter raffinosi TaxID=2953651 RepID=UPI00208E75C3|nr:branched-chain amino acid aminotransferase [Pseudarthrobacter sp. MDT3-9]MCO4252111.1 branched-chain amino acid aminotransferase [Pseudarthrobacter sp. MDT3-9]
MNIDIHPSPSPVPPHVLADYLADPGFGKYFTDHMVVIEWTPESGWHSARVQPYAPFVLDPAAAVLHYGQEIYEGMKAFRHPDGSVWTFRPRSNAARLNASARRMAMPEMDEELFVAATDALIREDSDWVPSSSGHRSLYLRPFMFASEPFLGMRPARHLTFAVIATPAAPYFPGDLSPVSIWVSEHFTRAGEGGTGAAKTGGNYAASFIAQTEGQQNNCDQVVFLDSVQRRWVEELGGMNLFFVLNDGSVVTPELTGTILEGITRGSIIELLKSWSIPVTERRISIDEWREGVANGRIQEVFACGTAAVVAPVGRLVWSGGELDWATQAGELTRKVRDALTDIQYGHREDSFGWLHHVK